MVKIGPAGHKKSRTDFFTIEMHVCHAQSGPVQGGAFYRCRQKKLMPEKWTRRLAGNGALTITNPLRILWEIHSFRDRTTVLVKNSTDPSLPHSHKAWVRAPGNQDVDPEP